MVRLNESQKKKVMNIINERVAEILDGLKEEFYSNLEESTIEETLAVVDELRALKKRVWRYK